MDTNIKPGDSVIILPNVTEELARMEFMNPNCADELIGTIQTAYDVYAADAEQFDGKEEWFVTVDLCLEIPLASCQLVNKSE